MSRAFFILTVLAGLVAAVLLTAVIGGCASTPRLGDETTRRGDEIIIAGRMFHTGSPVVLWSDPGGYDGYRTEKRFVPWARAAFRLPTEGQRSDGPSTPARYGVRFAPGNQDGPLSPDDFERIRGGAWDLPTLQSVVDQFVLHYDVCGVSRQCFRILHDIRGLSVHFMIDIDGTIYQTLDVKEKAWHATVSNDRSVGVEIAHMGAYGPGEKNPLAQWYAPIDPARPELGTRITIPPTLDGGGVRTPNFVGSPRLPMQLSGVIHDRELSGYDYTPEQYESLINLTVALSMALPRIELEYPRSASGQLLTTNLSPDALKTFRGVLGHYHIQANKIDPGPMLDWDYLMREARSRAGRPAMTRAR
jgi:N-acetylmuramoyl-L-alanine amidase